VRASTSLKCGKNLDGLPHAMTRIKVGKSFGSAYDDFPTTIGSAQEVFLYVAGHCRSLKTLKHGLNQHGFGGLRAKMT